MKVLIISISVILFCSLVALWVASIIKLFEIIDDLNSTIQFIIFIVYMFLSVYGLINLFFYLKTIEIG